MVINILKTISAQYWNIKRKTCIKTLDHNNILEALRRPYCMLKDNYSIKWKLFSLAFGTFHIMLIFADKDHNIWWSNSWVKPVCMWIYWDNFSVLICPIMIFCDPFNLTFVTNHSYSIAIIFISLPNHPIAKNGPHDATVKLLFVVL